MASMSPSADNRIRLREVTAADLPTLFAHQNDPEANRLAAVVPRSWETFEAHWSKCLANPDVTTRAILLNETLAGQITCFRVEERWWVGYWIDRAQWGRGIATQALAMMLDLVSVRPIFACVAVHNERSLRVLQQCGFVETDRRWHPGDERYLACEEVILKLA
jgi:RimJ/RimL family protein N-acetyltransferase